MSEQQDQPRFESSIPPRFAEEELVLRLEKCIDEAIGDMNLTSIEIVGALETVKFTQLLRTHGPDSED